jgi:chromosome segregation ATPase
MDGEDFVELRAMRQEMSETRKDTDELRIEVSQIRKDMQQMNDKQNDVVDAVTVMQSSVDTISSQLQAMSQAIHALRPSHTTSKQPETQDLTNNSEIPQKSPIFQRHNQGKLTEELKQRLHQEQQRTRYVEMLTSVNLPAINTCRRSAPPGFAGFNKQQTQSKPSTPQKVVTPAFNSYPQNKPKLDQLWEGYAREYEKEM